MNSVTFASSPQSPTNSSIYKSPQDYKFTPTTTMTSIEDDYRTIKPGMFNFANFEVFDFGETINCTTLLEDSVISELEYYKELDNAHSNDYDQNEQTRHQKSKRRFSVILPQCKSLLSKLIKRDNGTKSYKNFKSLSTESTEEALENHVNPYFTQPYQKHHSINLTQNIRVNSFKSIVSEICHQPLNFTAPIFQPYESMPQHNTCIIPEQYRNKKMPYLVKKIRTGYLKFFDEKNNYGFISLFDEPNCDVFVFGKEFAKSNISAHIIAIAKGDSTYVLKCRVMYYVGRHGPSRKAVNIRL